MTSKPDVAITSSHPAAFAWRESLPLGHLGHYVKVQSGLTEELPRVYVYQLLGKVLCHVLVSLLPDAALPEAGEQLARLYRFYSNGPSSFLIPQEKLDSFSGSTGETRTRPEIEITEE